MDTDQIKRLYFKMGYRWRDGGRINLFGIRNYSIVTDKFDDWLGVAWDDPEMASGVNTLRFDGTTRAGRDYFQNPMNAAGCAVLPPGQYLETWAFGMHQNKYEAFCQVEPLTIWRDDDRDNDIENLKTDRGLFGINIHRSAAGGAAEYVGRYSAGCQVFKRSDDFDMVMRLAHANAARFNYRRFDYTLFELSDLQIVKG